VQRRWSSVRRAVLRLSTRARADPRLFCPPPPPALLPAREPKRGPRDRVDALASADDPYLFRPDCSHSRNADPHRGGHYLGREEAQGEFDCVGAAGLQHWGGAWDAPQAAWQGGGPRKGRDCEHRLPELNLASGSFNAWVNDHCGLLDLTSFRRKTDCVSRVLAGGPGCSGWHFGGISPNYRCRSKQKCQSRHRAANEQGQGLRTTIPWPLEGEKWTVTENYQALKNIHIKFFAEEKTATGAHISMEKVKTGYLTGGTTAAPPSSCPMRAMLPAP
jgi:hypothetical protein